MKNFITGQPILHPPNEPGDSDRTTAQRGLRRIVRFAFRSLILAIALFFFALAIRRAVQELSHSEINLDWQSVGWGYLISSVLCGMVALLPPCVGWHGILRDFGQRIRWQDCFYAYFLGHMGKYVPGKAMAVLLRVGELHRHRVLLGPAVLSVFIETLSGFATGGILGAVLLQLMDCPRWLQLSSLVGIPIAIVSLLPHPFRWILSPLVRTRLGKSVSSTVEAIDGWMMLRTVLLAIVGWILQGVSLWLVLESLKGIQTDLLLNRSDWQVLMVCIASMSLGGLAGFLSMLPGGAIARELASIGILVAIIPEPIALIATVLVRLTSILAELLLVASFRWIQYRCRKDSVTALDPVES